MKEASPQIKPITHQGLYKKLILVKIVTGGNNNGGNIPHFRVISSIKSEFVGLFKLLIIVIEAREIKPETVKCSFFKMIS